MRRPDVSDRQAIFIKMLNQYAGPVVYLKSETEVYE